jgi:hypothetical protein
MRGRFFLFEGVELELVPALIGATLEPETEGLQAGGAGPESSADTYSAGQQVAQAPHLLHADAERRAAPRNERLAFC